ncbi:diguanylate cyclase [Thioalkalivibrio sp. ALJ24]|uniref:sensor domain-containing diguanylate cyclase n=1 Tax=Thioalkalivibrio sp. ALJ24 TaxID=545276 RepID=UPI00035C8756|nr:diguanylate cyclase [Thioalkalivibrio sp. ALJ24]
MDEQRGTSKPPEWLVGLGIMALVGLGYFAGAWLGVTQTVSPDGKAIIWPPNAVVLAALLLLPVRRWAWVVPAVMAAELAADLPTFPLWAALSFGMVNLFEVFLAASLIRWFTGPRFDFDSLARGGYFLLFGPLLAAGVAALFGAGIYRGLLGEEGGYLAHWQMWWFGDALGLLVLTPLLVILIRQHRELLRGWTGGRVLEAGALLVLLAAMATVLLTTGRAEDGGHPLALVLLLPPVLWAAARFGVAGAALLVALVAATAVVWMVHVSWPMYGVDPEGAILAMQEFLAVTAITGIGVGLFMREIESQRMRLRLFERAMKAINDAVIITDARRRDNPIIWVNDTFEKLFGYSREEVMGRNCRFLQHGNNEQPGVQEVREALRREEPVQTLVRNYRRDGEPLWIQLSLAPVCDAHNRVTHYVGVQRDLTEFKRSEEDLEQRVAERTAALQEANQRLERIASTDPLTGIANRWYFLEVAERELLRRARNSSPVSLLMLDLDHFKQVNDTWGHPVGDRVLHAVADTLRDSLRPLDLSGRFGGEEFLVLLPGTHAEEAREIAERLRRAVAAMAIEHEGESVRVTVSIGVAISDGERDIDGLICKADNALYRAKSEGRDRVVIDHPGAAPE